MINAINSRKTLYRFFVELTMIILLVSGWFWVDPPESVTELNACEVRHIKMILSKPQNADKTSMFEPFFAYEQNTGLIPNSETSPDFCKKANNWPQKWMADIMRYLTPVYFENFITYVVEVHWWILVGMLSTLFYLNYRHKYHINKLDKACREMSDLL